MVTRTDSGFKVYSGFAAAVCCQLVSSVHHNIPAVKEHRCGDGCFCC